MSIDHQEAVRSIVEEATYMTVATSDGERPWIAPVQFCADPELNLYFVSLPTSRHATEAEKNSRVAVAIFDSRQPPFTSRGVQIDGTISRWSDSENPFATIAGMDMPEDLQEMLPGYAAYRIEPQHFYVPRAYLESVAHDEHLEVHMRENG